MSNRLLIDPILLTMQEANMPIEALSKFCLRIRWLYELTQENAALLSTEMVQAFFEDNVYPLDYKLREGLEKVPASEQPPVDIASELLTMLLQLSIPLEQLSGYASVEAEEFSVTPPELTTRLSKETQVCWQTTLVHETLRQKEKSSSEAASIVTAEIPEHTLAEVATKIIEANPPTITITAPETISQLFLLNNCTESKFDEQDLNKFNSILEIVSYASSILGHLTFLDSATKSAKESIFANKGIVLDALKKLDRIAAKRKNAIKEKEKLPLAGLFLAEELDYAAGTSQLTKEKYKNEYYVDYKGGTFCCEQHVKLGNSWDRERCLRIYFFFDPDNHNFVIEHVGDHKSSIIEERLGH